MVITTYKPIPVVNLISHIEDMITSHLNFYLKKHFIMRAYLFLNIQVDAGFSLNIYYSLNKRICIVALSYLPRVSFPQSLTISNTYQ